MLLNSAAMMGTRLRYRNRAAQDVTNINRAHATTAATIAEQNANRTLSKKAADALASAVTSVQSALQADPADHVIDTTNARAKEMLEQQHVIAAFEDLSPTLPPTYSISSTGGVQLKRASRLARLSRSMETVRWTNVMDSIQALLGVLSTLLWMVQSYPAYANDLSILWIQFALGVVYIVDFVFRCGSSGVLYLATRWAIIDLLTILPIMFTMYQLNFYTGGNTATNGFKTFIVALTVPWQFLTLARFLRVFKLLRIAELRKLTFWSNNELSRGLSSLLLTVLTIIVLGGGLMFLIENTFPGGTAMTFNQSLYFMVVTISTVGYGDIAPTTVLGQVAIMCIILFAIVVVPMQTTEFVSNLSEYTKYGSAYSKKRTPHVVLVASASMTSDDLDAILHEFFHSNHGFIAYDLVILSNGGEEHRKKLLYHVKSTQYWSQVSYIVGSPSSCSDLEKAGVSRAQAVFLMSATRFVDAEQELAADEESLLRAISIKHFCPYVPLIISLNSPRNKAHVLWFQLSKFPNIQVVCLNEIKMKLFATACVCPGVLGLMTNLVSSYDGKSSFGSLFASSSSPAETSRATFTSSSTRSFTAESLIAHPLSLSTWPMSSARSPAYPLPPDPPIMLAKDHSTQHDDGSASLFFNAGMRRWEEEYLFGFGFEMYSCEFPSVVDGMCFSEAAAILYERLSLVLIAVYRTDLDTGKVRVILNPGYSLRLSVAGGDLACVIAQNSEHAAAAKSVHYAPSNIRERWRRARENDRLRARTTKWQENSTTAVDRRTPPASARPADSAQPVTSFSNTAEPLSPLSPDDGSDSLFRVDRLDMFRCNGQAVVPSMPITSLIAQSNLAESDQRQQLQLELANNEHLPEGSPENGLSRQLSTLLRDARVRSFSTPLRPQQQPSPISHTNANAVHGKNDDHVIDTDYVMGDCGQLATKAEEDRKDCDVLMSNEGGDITKGNSARSSTHAEHPNASHTDDTKPQHPSQAADLDPFSSHVVICGFIDTKIIGFIRRFRESDRRTIVLVFDNAVCFPLPPVVHRYILDNFENVHILFAGQSYKARHQKDRLFLAYVDPCFGHHHCKPSSRSKGARRHDSANISALAQATTTDGQLGAAAAAATEPRLPIDEYSSHDRVVEKSLHLTATYTAVANNHDGAKNETKMEVESADDTVAAYSYAFNGEDVAPMDYHTMLAHGNWYRRACVHRADSVVILANPYSAPPGSSSQGGGAMNEDSSLPFALQLLTSLYSTAQRTTTLIAADEQLKADQHGLILYSGINAYLQQCRTSQCPSLRLHITPDSFNVINVDLVYHLNVRLLKHDADATEPYNPTRPQQTGWAWLWRKIKKQWTKRSGETRRKKLRANVSRKRSEKKQKLFAKLKGTKLVDEQRLDRMQGSSKDDDGNEDDDNTPTQSVSWFINDADQIIDSTERSMVQNLQEHAKAFYTSDGLMFSSKLLDALIVQAFYHPLVYDTISALVGGYCHAILKDDFDTTVEGVEETEDRAMLSSPSAEPSAATPNEESGSAEERTFRVELLLLDMPESLIGRTFGFLQLKLIIENGWTVIGLYRDRRAVTRLARRTRRKLAQVTKGDPAVSAEQPTTEPQPAPEQSLHPQDTPLAMMVSPVCDSSQLSNFGLQSSLHAPSMAMHTRSNKDDLPSAVEMMEMRRRQEALHVTGLHGHDHQPRPDNRPSVPRDSQHHHHHSHTHKYRRVAQPGAGECDDAELVMTRATTIGKHAGSSTARLMRQPPVHTSLTTQTVGESYRSSVLPTHTEGTVRSDDGNEHRRLRTDTFQQPQARTATEADGEEKERPGTSASSEPGAPAINRVRHHHHPHVCNEHHHRRQHQSSNACASGHMNETDVLKDAGERERSYSAASATSTARSCSSDFDSDSDSDSDAENAGDQTTAYSARCMFYVLTNPPADTILHARDRIYVLVQRWMNPSTAERVLDEGFQPGGDHITNSGNVDDVQLQPDPSIPMPTVPRSYSPEGDNLELLASLPEPFNQPSHSPLPHSHVDISALQQQLSAQQAMLEQIAKQLVEVTGALSGQRERADTGSLTHAQPSGVVSKDSSPAVSHPSSPRRRSLNPFAFPITSRHHVPAHDGSVLITMDDTGQVSRSSGVLAATPLRRVASGSSLALDSFQLTPIAGERFIASNPVPPNSRPPNHKRRTLPPLSSLSLSDIPSSSTSSSLPMSHSQPHETFSSLPLVSTNASSH